MDDASQPGGKSSAGPAGQRRLGNRAIGQRLRQMYEGVVEESVPDEFLRLLEEAEATERGDAAETETGKP